MAKHIQTEIRIQASPEKIWSIFSNFNAYPRWNPFIKSLTGPVKQGAVIAARIEPPGMRGMTFKPRVLAFVPNQELTWLGSTLVRGLFDGEHSFRLQANADGSTTFTQSEKFSGLLSPVFNKDMLQKTKQGFMLMNEKLKELAEAK